MYGKILVAVDGSFTSELALREAIGLATDLAATLLVVHVVDEGPAYLNVDTTFQFEMLEHARRMAGQEVIDKAVATVRAAGLHAESKVVEIITLNERVADAIAAEAQRWSADLIVIGAHGRRGLRQLMLGSVAEGVLRTVTKPLLVVRGQ